MTGSFTARMTVRLPAVLLCAALLCAGCSKKEVPAADTDAKPASIVETTVVHPELLTDKLDLPAQVAADPSRTVHIYPPLSGRVLNLFVRPGQEVTKGQPVALLQSGDLAQARSDFEKARIEAARSDLQLDRAKQLLAHQVFAQKDYDDLKAADDAAHSELDRTRQRIRELGFSETSTSDEATLRAPISGAVLDIGTAAGELQKSLDNANSIATIANLDTVWVLGDVYERDLSTVKNGSDVTVTVPAYPGLRIPGKVQNVSDAFDPTTRTLKARVVVANNDHRLKPLMFATLSIVRSEKTGFRLPASAVIHDGDTAYVFVKNSAGNYDRRAVTAGDTHGDKTDITAGLKDGDSVVTTGAALLRAPVQGD